MLRVITEILGAEEPEGRGTDIEGAIQYLSRIVRKKAVVFLISGSAEVAEALPDAPALRWGFAGVSVAFLKGICGEGKSTGLLCLE